MAPGVSPPPPPPPPPPSASFLHLRRMMTWGRGERGGGGEGVVEVEGVKRVEKDTQAEYIVCCDREWDGKKRS